MTWIFVRNKKATINIRPNEITTVSIVYIYVVDMLERKRKIYGLFAIFDFSRLLFRSVFGLMCIVFCSRTHFICSIGVAGQFMCDRRNSNVENDRRVCVRGRWSEGEKGRGEREGGRKRGRERGGDGAERTIKYGRDTWHTYWVVAFVWTTNVGVIVRLPTSGKM